MQLEQRRWRKREIGVAIGFGALLIAKLTVWIVKLGSASRVAEETPQVASFPDGSELRIYRGSVGELAVDYPEGGSWKLITGASEGTYSFGDAGVTTNLKNGQVVRRVARVYLTDALLLDISLHDPNGAAQRLPSYLDGGHFISHDSRFGAGDTFGRSFEAASNSLPDLEAAMIECDLSLLIQHHDPQAGWVDLTGPYLFDADSMTRSVVALSAWQRDLEKLEFRAIRSDGAVAEFSLPNPDFKKSPAKVSPGPLPQMHRAADYAVELRGVKRLASRGHHPFAEVDMTFESGGKTVKGDHGDPVALGGMTATDEWGNRLPFELTSIQGKLRMGAYLPTASRHMTLRMPVRRTQNHPRNATDGVILLEGVVAADGVNVEFQPSSAAAGFGIEKTVSGTIRLSNEPFEVTNWKVLEVSVSISGSEAELKSLESRMGKLTDWQLQTFPGESQESAGVLGIPIYSSSTGTLGFSFEIPYQWQAPPDLLKPGAKMKIGIFGPLPGDDLTFELDLPTEISGK